MENQTSFDLNLAIQHWRENLAQSAAFQTENLNELESHLRDCIATLQTSALSAEESFLIASRRIGKGGQLANEFGKMNQNSIWLDRLLWMVVGAFAWLGISGPLSALPVNLFALGWPTTQIPGRVQGDAWPVTIFSAVRIIATAATVWLFWWLIFCKGGQVNRWLRSRLQRRSSFTIYCIGACLFVLLLQVLASSLPAYLLWRNGPAAVGQMLNCLSWSHAIVQFSLLIGLILFALSLARKRFFTESA